MMLLSNTSENQTVSTLEELCSGQEGGIQTGPFGSQLHKKDYVIDGTPIITVEHLLENRISHKDIPRVSEADKARLAKYTLRKGDIVFSRVGSVDRRSIVREEEDGWLFSGRCLRVRPNPSKVDPSYLSYYLGHPLVKRHLRSIAVGATMPSLNTKLLSGIDVLLPRTITEQKAIAHILGTLDDKIELNSKTNETLEAMAKALFKSWFVDFDPVRAKAEGRSTGLPAEISDLFPDSFEDSELGEIPSGWSVSTLGDAIKWNHGKTWEAHMRVSDSPTVVLGSNGAMGRCSVEMGSDRIIVMGNRGSCGALNDFVGSYWVTNNAYYITEKENKHLEYFRQVLRATDFSPLIGGSSNPFMPLKNFAHINIVLAPQSIFHCFSDNASPLRHRVEDTDSINRTLSAIRDALIPKLISGEIRIPDAEKMLEEVGI